MGVLQLGMSMTGGGLDAALAALSARLDSISVPLEEFGGTMLDSIRLNFDLQGRPKKWRPLSPYTVRRKGNDIILVDTGRLKGSIGFRTGHDSLTLYTTTPYAAVHQHGGKAGRGGLAVIPARPFLLFQEEDIARLKGLLADFILKH